MPTNPRTKPNRDDRVQVQDNAISVSPAGKVGSSYSPDQVDTAFPDCQRTCITTGNKVSKLRVCGPFCT